MVLSGKVVYCRYIMFCVLILFQSLWKPYYNLLPVRCVAHACAEVFLTDYEDDAQIKAAVIEQAATIRANPDILLAYSGTSGALREILSGTAMLLKS